MTSQVMGHADYVMMTHLQVPQYNSGKHLFNESPSPGPYILFQTRPRGPTGWRTPDVSCVALGWQRPNPCGLLAP